MSSSKQERSAPDDEREDVYGLVGRVVRLVSWVEESDPSVLEDIVEITTSYLVVRVATCVTLAHLNEPGVFLLNEPDVFAWGIPLADGPPERDQGVQKLSCHGDMADDLGVKGAPKRKRGRFDTFRWEELL